MISIYCPSNEWDEFNESVEWEDGVAYVKAKKEFEKNPKTYLVDINTILHDGNRGCVDELINDPELSEQIKVGVSAARVIICSAPTIIEAEE